LTSIESIKRMLHPQTADNTVYRTRDTYGEILIFDVGKWRILTFGSIFEQSCIQLDDPALLVHEYSQAMLLPLLAMRPDHITMLGLGGGGFVHALLQAVPHAHIDIVELRQAVIDVAYSHFFLSRTDYISVYCRDAGDFVKETKTTTDLILCDLYDEYDASALQLDEKFYARCKRILKPSGWLALNYHQLPSIEHPAIKSICQYFESVFLAVVNSGNWVVLASNADVARDNGAWQCAQLPDMPLRRQLALLSHRLIRIELVDNVASVGRG